MDQTNIAGLSIADKIGEALKRSLPHLPGAARAQVEQLLNRQTLAVVAATMTLWIAAHFVGVGEAIDIILLVVGAFSVGLAIFEGIEEVWLFASISHRATTSGELDEAAKHFASAVSILGVQAVLAVLFRNRPRTYKGGRFELEPPPIQPKSGPFVQPTLRSTRTRPPGTGVTSPWGEIEISRLGSPVDRRLAAIHENIHRVLTPCLTTLREFRVQNRTSSYVRSALSKYLEEALAETVAQVTVNGFRAVFRGVTFPVRERYVSLIRVGEGLQPFLPEAGSLLVGGFMLSGMTFKIWDSPTRPRGFTEQ